MADKIPESGRIAEGFYLLNLGFVTSYILDAGESLVAFDVGMWGTTIRREMGKLGLDPERIRHIFITHSDPDHVGCIRSFPQARVHFPMDEVAMVDRRTARFFGWYFNKALPVAYEALVDGQVLGIGNAKIECISTPGHTAGSMSYLANGSALVVGDELNLDGGEAVLDRGFICLDNEKRKESILKLARLAGVEYLCPMHSGYTGDFAKAMGHWTN